MSSNTTDHISKRPRRQCVKCLDCNRSMNEATLQENDTKNFIPKVADNNSETDGNSEDNSSWERCKSCNMTLFDRVDHEAIQYDGKFNNMICILYATLSYCMFITK